MFNFKRKKKLTNTASKLTPTTKLKGLDLYYRSSCPYCKYVIAFLKSRNIKISVKDITANPNHLEKLAQEGGKVQVPCLSIKDNKSTKWLYESTDIVEYISQQIQNKSTIQKNGK